MSPEVARHIANDDTLCGVERPSGQLAPYEFGADRVPPVFSRRALGREIGAGKKIQIEDLLGNRLVIVRLDLERPVEMLDCGGRVSKLSETRAEQSEADFRGRILLKHLVAGDDSLRHSAGEQVDLGFSAPCQL